jgi:hypothetical protein
MTDKPEPLGVICECGAQLPVEEDAAGSTLNCSCGRRVIVPLLAELKARRVALSAATIERRIQRMVVAGDLPDTDQCMGCNDGNAAEIVPVVVECERAKVRTSGGFRFLILPFVRVWYYEEQRVEILGRDTAVASPLCLCARCQGEKLQLRGWIYALIALALAVCCGLLIFWNYFVAMVLLPFALAVPYVLYRFAWNRRQRSFKTWLRKVPVYGQLLNRYPWSVVLIQESPKYSPVRLRQGE